MSDSDSSSTSPPIDLCDNCGNPIGDYCDWECDYLRSEADNENLRAEVRYLNSRIERLLSMIKKLNFKCDELHGVTIGTDLEYRADKVYLASDSGL